MVSDFFKSSTAPVTLDYATENYLSRVGVPTSIASSTNFTGDLVIAGDVNFNNLSSPPHCEAVAVSNNDLVNKLYVDTVAPRVAYIVYLNYSETFITTTPNTYKKLSSTEIFANQTVPFTTTNGTPLLIASFFNTITSLKFSNPIPAGNWTLLTYANVQSLNDQQHAGLSFVLIGITAGGVETIIATSVSSSLISVVSPLIGSYSSILTLASTDISTYTQIGIKVYVTGNENNRNGNIFFQFNNSYTELITSYGLIASSDILTTANTWTNTNSFSNATSGALSSTADALEVLWL